MKLHYKKIGQGPPAIFLHGLFGSCDNWLSMAKRFQHQYTIYLPDLRNHGHSPHSNIHDYPAMSEDLHEFVTDHNLNQVILLGHSMGGKAVMRYAIDYPDRVKCLIVGDIAPKIYRNKSRFLLQALVNIDLKTIHTREDADKVLENKIKHKPIRQLILKNLHRKDDMTFEWKLNLEALQRNIVTISGNFTENDKFTKPTLFLKGEKSNYILPSDLLLINTIFSDVRIIHIPKAGHWIHSDNPDFVFETIDNFLSNRNKIT